MDTLPLAEALRSLRGELADAIDQARDEEITFLVENIELQLQVVATTSTGGTVSGGLWQVLTVGGKADHSRATTHQIKLVLRPQVNGEAAIHVGDESTAWEPATMSGSDRTPDTGSDAQTNKP